MNQYLHTAILNYLQYKLKKTFIQKQNVDK